MQTLHATPHNAAGPSVRRGNAKEGHNDRFGHSRLSQLVSRHRGALRNGCHKPALTRPVAIAGPDARSDDPCDADADAGGGYRPEVSIAKQVVVPAPLGDVFDFPAAEDVLPKILTGYRQVPGVAFTSDVSGPWDRAGSHRIVHLADGSTVQEGLTRFQAPHFFAYRIWNPSFALRHLITDAEGAFSFVETAHGTELAWSYRFHARNRLAKVALRWFVEYQWKGYMEVCLRNILAQFDGRLPDAPAAD